MRRQIVEIQENRNTDNNSPGASGSGLNTNKPVGNFTY